MSNFQNILQEVENKMKNNAGSFSTDEGKKLRIEDPNQLLNRQLTEIEEQMVRRISVVDEYSWNRGSLGGLKTGFTCFDDATEGGVQPGLMLFAAAPNVGKSAFMLQLMKQVSELNSDAHCTYISLDDSLNEIMPRWIASDQNITIGQAKTPERYQDNQEIMERRNEGLKNMYRLVDRFTMMDAEDSPSSIEELEEYIKTLKMTLPEDKKIVLGIDSFYDLRTEKNFGGNDKAKFEHISYEVKNFAHIYDISIMATAHLKKTGSKRPIAEDLKESNRLEFDANLICLLYNDVGINEEASDIYWLHEEKENKMPVLEMRFAKNKFSHFKGTKFFEFIPAESYFMESSEEASKRYASLVYQS